MLSILIPLYNYNISELLNSVYSQCEHANIIYEIIILDDNSSTKQNKIINDKNVIFIKNESNIGRTETRQKLSKKAQYNWLLFLDADVLPVNTNFIENYFNKTKSINFDLCYGGLKYSAEKPSKNEILRWKYGIAKEDISPEVRKKKPFKNITSANLLIKKELFIDTNKDLIGNLYGYDTIFSLKLIAKKAKVLHIENPVYHLGLESNEVYLKKKELSVETIFKLYKNKKLNTGNNDLLKTFVFLKKIKLITLVASIFKQTKKILTRNILSSNPNIKLLNLYKLGYFCQVYSNEK